MNSTRKIIAQQPLEVAPSSIDPTSAKDPWSETTQRNRKERRILAAKRRHAEAEADIRLRCQVKAMLIKKQKAARKLDQQTRRRGQLVKGMPASPTQKDALLATAADGDMSADMSGGGSR